MQSGDAERRIHNLDRRVDELGHRTEIGLGRIEAEMRATREEFGRYQRTIARLGGGLIGVLVLGVCGIIATQI